MLTNIPVAGFSRIMKNTIPKFSKTNNMRQRKQMPVRSKFKPTESKVETTKQSIVRKYMDLFGCDVKTAHNMYRDFIFKTQMSKPELYVAI
jgi:hypothetical protein